MPVKARVYEATGGGNESTPGEERNRSTRRRSSHGEEDDGHGMATERTQETLKGSSAVNKALHFRRFWDSGVVVSRAGHLGI